MNTPNRKKQGLGVFKVRHPILMALFIAILTLLGTSSVYAARYWCHDHSLFLASKGKERVIGTGPNILRDKLQFFYGYQREKTFPNLSALMSSGYTLKPGQVVIIGEAHSAYVESPSVLQHYFGDSYTTVGVLHWTLNQFYRYTRTAKITDPSKPVKTVYPMRGKSIQIWTDTTLAKQEAEQKLKLLENEVLDYLKYLRKQEVKKVALQAVSLNEFMKEWSRKELINKYIEDANILGNACGGKGKVNKSALEQIIQEMKNSSDIILKAHDATNKHADAVCNASTKDEVDLHLKQAKSFLQQARDRSLRISGAKAKLSEAGLSQLFKSYSRIKEQHLQIVRDLLNIGSLTGVNYLAISAEKNRYSPPEGYDNFLDLLGKVKIEDRRRKQEIDKLKEDLLKTVKPFIKSSNWAAKIKAKADALVTRVNSTSSVVVNPINNAILNLLPGKLYPVLSMESVMGASLKQCTWLEPLHDQYKEALSHYEPAKIFVERTFDHYARALDCRDKFIDKKRSTKSIIKLSGKASNTKIKKGDKVSFLYTVSIGDHASVINVQLQDGFCGVVSPKSGDKNADGKLDKTETWIYECSATIQDDADNRIHVSAIDENGDPVMASLLLQVKVELTEEEKKKKEKKDKIRMLWLEPVRSTVKIEEKVAFTASLIFEDNSEKTLSPSKIKWEPGPGNTFSSKEAGTYWVTAYYKDYRATATINVEEGESRTKWDKPISHADELTNKALPPPPDAFTWYVFCEKDTGDVSYGEGINVAKHKVLGGPFQGPRDTKLWIDQNYPSWRCPTTGVRGQWNIMCNKQNFTVAIGKSTDPTRYWTMQGGFVSEKDARKWVGQNCPSWACSQGGACSTSPREGGDWAVVCSKDHGGIGLTEYPDPTRSWIFTSGLLAETDARLWVELRCPSWRCNREGQCMTGIPKHTKRKPLETPPELDSLFSAGGEVDADKMVKKPEISKPKQDKDYDFGRRLGDLLGKKLKEELKRPEPPATTRKSDTGVTWESKKADCSAERKKLSEQANNMTEQAKKLNCEKGNRYSGCALDVVGPFFPYWPDRVFSDEACSKPGYVGCASGAFSGYVGCLNGCNSAWRGGSRDLKGCGQRCFKQIEQTMKRCNAN